MAKPKRVKLRKRKGFKQRVVSTVISMAETHRVLYNNLALPIEAIGGSLVEYNMTAITQGNGDNQRHGSKVLMTGLYLQGQITFPDSTNMVRCIIYLKKGAHETNPLSTRAVGVKDYWDPFGYQVLRDFTMSGGSNGPVCKNIKVALNFKNRRDGGIPVEYSSTTATSLANNQIGIYFVGDSLAANHPLFNGYFISYYKDF